MLKVNFKSVSRERFPYYYWPLTHSVEEAD